MSRLPTALAGAILLSTSFATTFAQAADVAPPEEDTCLVLAKAKYDQWTQRRVLINQTKTFEDGSTKAVTLLVTENTAYLQSRTQWRSRSVAIRDRAVPPPEKIAQAMGLGTCTKAGDVTEADQAATLYSYDYVPDKDGYVAHGKMWISNESGLPLKEEMQDPAPPANAMVAKAITATYKYNNDFEIPPDAERAESNRLFDASQLMRHLQSGSGTGLGGGRR